MGEYMHWWQGIIVGGILGLVSSASAQIPPKEPSPISTEVLLVPLLEALADTDIETRQNVALTLANLGSPAVAPLIETLKDRNAVRRAGAAYALAQLGPTAKAAVPALVKALKDDDINVRRQAAYALQRITAPEPPLPPLNPPLLVPPPPERLPLPTPTPMDSGGSPR